jgi:hypothetical protein
MARIHHSNMQCADEIAKENLTIFLTFATTFYRALLKLACIPNVAT